MPLIDYHLYKPIHAALHKVWSKTSNVFSGRCESCGASYDKQDWKDLEKAIDNLARFAQKLEEATQECSCCSGTGVCQDCKGTGLNFR